RIVQVQHPMRESSDRAVHQVLHVVERLCMMVCMDTMLTISERLRIARERAGLSGREMGDLIGRHRNRITAYESAGDDVQTWVVRAYAEHLPNEATFEWLIAEVGTAPRVMVGTHRSPRAITGEPWFAPTLFDYIPDTSQVDE